MMEDPIIIFATAAEDHFIATQLEAFERKNKATEMMFDAAEMAVELESLGAYELSQRAERVSEKAALEIYQANRRIARVQALFESKGKLN